LIEIEVDQPKRLLVIRHRGRIGAGEVEQHFEEARAGVAKLQPGFRVLVDLSELESMDVSAAPCLEKIMDLCNEKGVSKVVRVIPDPHRDIGLQIMSYFHYGSGVQITTCNTLAEAAELLRP
jgi:anti-anti-sigma regulatory factor